MSLLPTGDNKYGIKTLYVNYNNINELWINCIAIMTSGTIKVNQESK